MTRATPTEPAAAGRSAARWAQRGWEGVRACLWSALGWQAWARAAERVCGGGAVTHDEEEEDRDDQPVELIST